MPKMQFDELWIGGIEDSHFRRYSRMHWTQAGAWYMWQSGREDIALGWPFSYALYEAMR